VKTFKVGDLVQSTWGHSQPLAVDLGVVMGTTDGFDYNAFEDWSVYNVYWFQAGKVYPVFAHDLILYKRKENENNT
tara:strand:- start:387 stop:614 length:228 start_codon:yes stop_codon:yes gene_type:complete